MRQRSFRFVTFSLIPAVLALLSAVAAPPCEAGLADRLKKKVADKAAQKAEEKVSDKASASEAETEADANAEAAPKGDGGAVSEVSTKFDYVPGDKVLFYDDFTGDELGEFPAQWSLAGGNFEVAEKDGERWLRCTSADGHIRMNLPTKETLPEFWTLEFDFYGTEPMGSALTVRALSSDESECWTATYPQGGDLAFRTGAIFSTTTIEDAPVGGRHHVMVMARGKSVKVYMNRQRMANAPDISAAAGMPSILAIRLAASCKPMITNVRFAEGCQPPKDLLAQGKLVTYGIRFASGSDVVLPDSAPVLRQVAAYLESNPSVKLHIVGHTDNVGSPPSNLDLSKRRAASVAKVLADEFKIAADRFTTDGKGDTEKVADNSSSAGRAMNRRVEFAKS